MNVEVALLSKLLQSGKMDVVVDKQIRQTYFSGKYKRAYKFIADYQMKYGSVPSPRIFRKKFSDIILIDVLEEPLEFWCDELRTKKKHNMIVDSMEDIAKQINELDTDKAYSSIKKLVLSVETEVVLTDRKEINKSTQKRLDAYNSRSKCGGIVGIPTGFPKLDFSLKGFNNGEIITLLGFTGTGNLT